LAACLESYSVYFPTKVMNPTGTDDVGFNSVKLNGSNPPIWNPDAGLLQEEWSLRVFAEENYVVKVDDTGVPEKIMEKFCLKLSRMPFPWSRITSI